MDVEKGRSKPSITPIVTVGRRGTEGAGVEYDRRPSPAWALLGLVAVAVLIALLALPGDLLSKLTLLNSGVCPQRPAHSFFFEGRQMPLEARMVGIFAGYALTIFGLWLIGRGRALQWPRREVTLLLMSLVGLMVLDGLNSTSYDLHGPTLYEPQNWLRVLTGTVSGVGMAGLLLPVFNLTVWRRGYLTPTFRRSWEVGLAVGAAVLVGLGTLSGWGFLFWPLSLLAVAGVIVMLMMFNTLIALVVLRRENRASVAQDLVLPFTLVFLVSLGQMGLFAWLRVALAGFPASF